MGDKELWKCPKCGHQFVTANIWHSCGNYNFEHHFAGKDPVVEELFERFRKVVLGCGKAICYPQKTRIVFQRRMRFASCQTQKDSLRCGLILPSKYSGAKNLIKIEPYGPRCFGHYFKMSVPEDFDGAFAELVREAFILGGN